jgi:hypothetical protein
MADHGIENPSPRMRQKLSVAFLVIALRHGTPRNVMKVLLFQIPNLVLRGKREHFEKSIDSMKEIFPRSYYGVARMVYLYEVAGFYVVKNIEPDGDGQNYGTVYSMVAHQCKYGLELLRPTTA